MNASPEAISVWLAGYVGFVSLVQLGLAGHHWRARANRLALSLLGCAAMATLWSWVWLFPSCYRATELPELEAVPKVDGISAVVAVSVITVFVVCVNQLMLLVIRTCLGLTKAYKRNAT